MKGNTMNVILTRTSRATSFSALAAGATYAAADDNGKNFVYTKASPQDYDVPALLGKNRRGNPVGAALRNDGRVVFHFLDKKVIAVKAVAVAANGTVTFQG